VNRHLDRKGNRSNHRFDQHSRRGAHKSQRHTSGRRGR
jgi:hypothetical protein